MGEPAAESSGSATTSDGRPTKDAFSEAMVKMTMMTTTMSGIAMSESTRRGKLYKTRCTCKEAMCMLTDTIYTSNVRTRLLHSSVFVCRPCERLDLIYIIIRCL